MSEKKYLNKTMTDYVFDQKKPVGFSYLSFYEKVVNYANALSKTPRLGHFIPCDHNDIPLQKPIEYSGMDSDALYDVEQYQLACDRVLFEGCKYFESLSDFTSQRTPETEFAVVDNGKGQLVFCFYIKNEGFHSFFQIKNFEDLVKTRKNLPLSDNGAKFFGV